MLTDAISAFSAAYAVDQGENPSNVGWDELRSNFYAELKKEDTPEQLAGAVLDQFSWGLPVDCRLDLLRKVKSAGCNSDEFLHEYYRSMAAYLDPDEAEGQLAREMLDEKFRP